jgi:Ser/Thr protein kinase RdoA (MazF antagonist)
LVHPDIEPEFIDVCTEALRRIKPLFGKQLSGREGLPAGDFPAAGAAAAATGGLTLQRIHGDCHRGNILEHPDKGLLLIDFDDMMSGPVVQDFWLLLPGTYAESKREIGLLLEGYEDFSPFPLSDLHLIEPLRFMRMIHYLAWCARQRFDAGFAVQFPGWGTRAWWSREIEDLRRQLERLAE